MSGYVLDASAILAITFGEPGAERVSGVLRQSRVSAVNYSEACAKLVEKGFEFSAAVSLLRNLGVIVEDFDGELAISAARLRKQTRSKGLSLGDRCCLALAAKLDATALTTDRAWADVDAGCAVELIR